MTNEMNYWMKRGTEAYLSNKMRIPGWDTELNALSVGRQVGDKTWTNAAKAWLKGWDSACASGMMSDLN